MSANNFESLARNEALSWLFEMELLSSKQVQNALVLNILKLSSRILDVNYLIDQHQKRMLVYLKLSKWGKWFSKDKIEMQVSNMLEDVMPSYTFRIVFDGEILSKALEVAKSQ